MPRPLIEQKVYGGDHGCEHGIIRTVHAEVLNSRWKVTVSDLNGEPEDGLSEVIIVAVEPFTETDDLAGEVTFHWQYDFGYEDDMQRLEQHGL